MTEAGQTLPCVLREALAEDLPALLPLLAQLAPIDPEKALSTFQAMQGYPFYKTFLAVVEGRVVGTFGLLIVDNLGHAGAPFGVVENVVVETTLRGGGIGKRMMEHAHMLARERGCYKLILASGVQREAAHAFYESLGFEKRGYAFSLDL